MAATQSLAGGTANGTSTALTQIHDALEVVHGPYSTNDARRAASQYLEQVKAGEEAPYHGFTLASDRSQQPMVRHYALSLLEHALRHRWQEYSPEQANTLRGWILELSRNLAQSDPSYLRNKTAQLWIEVAKRCWGAEWTDMDQLLVQLWELPGSAVHKEFVLFVLEGLSEEIFNGEDTIAILREGALSKACVDIFTPAIVLAETFPHRQPGTAERCGEEGWLVRLGAFLSECLQSQPQNSAEFQTCAIKTLAVYRSVMPWAVPRAISSSSCVLYMCKSLAAASVPIQLAAVDALYALYNRIQFSDEEFVQLVCPMFRSDMVNLLRRLFEWSVVDPRDIDEEKYLFGKKLSEVLSNLGGYIDQKIDCLPDDCDLPNLLNLFLTIAQSPSFVVSIPIVVVWTRLLRCESIGGSSSINPLIAPLLELCSDRLLRYESLPEDTEDPSLMFLLEDIDTIPERHAFLGNYRRYSVQIIELIVRQKQSDAIYHILAQVDSALRTLYDGKPPFSAHDYSKTSMPVLRVDAQFTVVDAALKGFVKWRANHGAKPQEDEKQRVVIEAHLESWCGRLLETQYEDPLIRKRVLQSAVAFSTTALDKNVGFMLKVLEHILMSRPAEYQASIAYMDAIKDLHADGTHELQRLAIKMPSQLLDVYEQLESKVKEIIASGTVDSKRQTAYQTFLFTIIHRATNVDPQLRLQKLEGFVQPIQQLWQTPDLENALSSFGNFCDLMSLSSTREYLVSRHVSEIQEWSLYQLDAEGQAVQKQLEERLKALPLRTTKSYLACSTDKLERDSTTFKTTRDLWRPALPVVLPNVLKFLSHAHAFHNPNNWTGLPAEMRSLVGRMLTDRFWQAGISTGSKDDFYARVTGTKTTMEGLASSVRSSIRTVREACYSMLWCMSRLDVDFYGFSELPGPLAHALFADAHYLSTHQLIALLNVVRLLVDDCPVEVRDHFVPPILATCFTQLDSKCTTEWEKLAQKQVSAGDGDNLTDEMKEESILRQLTHTVVMMIGAFLDPARLNPGAAEISAKEASTYLPEGNAASAYPSMRKFCLSSSTILEPLLLLLAHAIRMRDTRCCGVVLRIYRSLIPEFVGENKSELTTAIREFISTDVLKACISSLNESYFVDLQKDIAQLIASILFYFSPHTKTPRNVLLSIPGLEEKAVDKCIEYITRQGTQQRQQRALVLDLLRDIKGVSISEQGRISKNASQARKERSKMQQEFMKEHLPQTNGRQPSPSFEGIASMLEETT